MVRPGWSFGKTLPPDCLRMTILAYGAADPPPDPGAAPSAHGRGGPFTLPNWPESGQRLTP